MTAKNYTLIKENHKLKTKKQDFIKLKARNLVRGLRWGNGSTQKMQQMILEVLDKPCYWCGTNLHIENIELDHKIPLKRPAQYSTSKLKALNSPKNLRIICERCNFIKGRIPEKDFKKLMDLLGPNRKLKYIVLDALYYANRFHAENYAYERFLKRVGIP